MTDISKITLPDNTTYNIKDKNARNFTNTPYYEQDEEALMFQLGESYMTGEQDNQPYLFRAAGGSADIGNREYDKIIGGTVAWNQLVRNEASTNETDFADIVTVDDAVEDAAEVKVAIESVQDLHGYDHPWPGGGGKNIFNGTFLQGYWAYANGKWASDTKWVTTEKIPCKPSTYYTASADNRQTRWQGFVYYDNNGDFISTQNLNNKLPIGYTAKTPANAAYLIFNIAGESETTDPISPSDVTHFQIEEGQTATSYAPYSNICPITGWTGAKVTRTGKNLLNDADARMNNASWWIGSVGTNDIPDGSFVLKAGTYTLSTSDVQSGFYIIDETGARIDAAYNKTSITFTISKDQPIKISLYKANTTIDYWSTVNIQLELSDTVTDYEPYQGETYDITFPTSAGTVYGGELTVNEDGTGSLVVDRKRFVIDQNSSFYGAGNVGYETSTGTNRYINDIDIQGTYYVQYDGCVSNILKRKYNTIWSSVNSAIWSFTFNNHQLHMVFENAVVGITDEMTSSQRTQAIKAWLANNNIEIIAPLAAPITYTLTTSQIRTLLGTNNVWADAGQVSLSYTGTDEHLVLKSDRKYLARISGTDSVLLGSGQEITAAKGTDNIFDLTQMFGTTIANYIYSLETATPGAGVAWFRKLFPKPYYEYNPGELMSVQAVAHKLVGFNAWDEEWELGIINTTTGEETDSNSNIRSKNYIRVIPGATYYFKLGTTDISNNIVFYDAEKNYVATFGEHVNDVFTVPEDAHYMKFYMSTNYGRTYLSNICINLSGNGERNGEYEEYNMHSYPLDSSLVLRGIPKLDANNQLYYDGDVYEADGTVTRRYGIVDLGTLTYTKTNSGLFLTLSLASNIKRQTSSIYATGWLLSSMYEEMASTPITGPNGTKPSPNLRMAENTVGHIYFNNTSYTDAETFKTAMNGVYLLYELATPTTETAEPYDNPQIVASEGTEEYITTNIVFVGHETKY